MFQTTIDTVPVELSDGSAILIDETTNARVGANLVQGHGDVWP